MEQILIEEEKLIEIIKAFNLEIVKQFRWVAIEGEDRNLLENLCHNPDFQLSPAQAEHLMVALRGEQDLKNQEQLLDRFKEEAAKKIKSLNQLKEEILSTLISKDKPAKIDE